MALNSDETISRLQSSSVRNSLILIIVNVLVIVGAATGQVFEIETIKAALDAWLPLIINAATAYWGWRAYRGRVIAEKKIEPLPWQKELETLVTKEKV